MRFQNLEAVNAELVRCDYEAIDYIESESKEEQELLDDLECEGVEDGEEINNLLIEWGEDDRNQQRDWANS